MLRSQARHESARADGAPSTGYDLTRCRPLAWWLRRRSWQFQVILPNQILFWLVIVVGFVGAREFDDNFGTTITWYVWFSLVFLLILLTGRGWCAVCPFGGLAEWLQRRRLWHPRGEARSPRERPVPGWLARYGYVTTAVTFAGLTWVEEYYEVADGTSPVRTSWTVIGIIVIAVAAFLIYERRAFCRYLCPLGGLIGVLGAGAPLLGFRARDRRVCAACPTRDCLRGNERGYGCPWFNWPGGSESSVHCGLCGECFRTCRADNVGLFVGRPLTGLTKATDRRADVAWTVAILGGVMMHQHLHETRAWGLLDDWANSLLNLSHGPNPVLYAVLVTVYTLLLVLPAWFAVRLLYRRPTGGLPDRGTSFVYRMSPFRVFLLPLCYAAIPILGSDFLAVEMLGFVQNAPKVIPAAGGLVGIGAGADSSLSSLELMSTPAVVRLQVMVLALGTLASAATMWRIAGAEIVPATRAPLVARIGGVALLAAGGLLLIAFYVVHHGEAG